MAKKPDLQKDADQVLQGIRIVLPGTQALIGFQFIAFFNPVFQSLSTNLKMLHFTTLMLAILCSIFLIAPVAFQQIGEGGSATGKLLKFSRKMLAIAMAFLLFAVTGDIYVAARTIGISNSYAVLYATAAFVTGVSLWYVCSLLRKSNKA